MKTTMLAGAYDSPGIEAMWAKRHAQVPMGHMGTPWDVAEAALFLVSDRRSTSLGSNSSSTGGSHSASHELRPPGGPSPVAPER
jgi:NAD(P)-dependent dehydrogenase (short-subunit alcohol dehydrogenase family)